MVCPLRIVVFAVSCSIIAAALFYYASGSELDILHLNRHERRSWWGFIKSLFTGELVYEAWYGPGSWTPVVDDSSGKEDKTE